MSNSLKSLSAIICFVFLAQAGFSQDEKIKMSSIHGEWDVVLESKSAKFSKEDLKYTKKRAKKANGNSNIAVLRFEKDGKFSLGSIKDYGVSTEEGTFIFQADKKTIVRTVKFPNAFKEKKRAKMIKIKARVLHVDDSYLVLRTNGKTLYMRRMG